MNLRKAVLSIALVLFLVLMFIAVTFVDKIKADGDNYLAYRRESE